MPVTLPSNQTSTYQGVQDALDRLRTRAVAPPPIDTAQMMAPAESTRVSPWAGSQVVNPVLERLKDMRSRYIADPLRRVQQPVMNALENVPTPYLPGFPGTVRVMPPGTTAADVAGSLAKGAALGSLILPDDMAVEPDNPIPALEVAGAIVGAVAEGFITEYGILSGIGRVRAVAQARGATNLARSADRALELFGQGEDATTLRRLMGGAALAGTSELALQTAALRDPIQILSNSGLVTLAGGTLGGTVAAVTRAQRAAVAGPRALKGFMQGFAEQAAPEIQQAMAVGADMADVTATVTRRVAEEQAAFAMRAVSEAEQGLAPSTAYLTRLDEAGRAIAAAKRLGDKGQFLSHPKVADDVGKTTSGKVEGLFDLNASETIGRRLARGFDNAAKEFQQAFVYEAKVQKFPSLTGVAGVTLADDFRLIQHGASRVARLAAKDIQGVVGPVLEFKGRDFQNAWGAFERIVVLRDLVESGGKGLALPLDLSLDEVAKELQRLEMQAPRQVLQAAEHHRQLVGEMRDELIRRGKLSAGDGFDNYFPHKIIDDLAMEEAAITGRPLEDVQNLYPTSAAIANGKLKTPGRAYTRKRFGSTKAIQTNYIDVMQAAVRRFHMDNMVDDFLGEIEKSPLNVKRAALTPDEISRLDNRGSFIRDGQQYKVFEPKGAAYYRAMAVDREAANTLRAMARGEIGIDPADLPEMREVLAVGQPKQLILPADLADRLEQFYQPDPLQRMGRVAGVIPKATSWWKRNTIWWGLTRFFQFQLIGDSINLMRDNPSAFLRIRNGRVDSPALRALNEQFKQYGAPMMSKEQFMSTLGGGALGWGATEYADPNADPASKERIAAILGAAGLGYVGGTKYMAGRGRAFSQLYELADELAVVNSGRTAGDEELARRILGENFTITPGQGRPHYQRALDSISTLLTGKSSGSPYAPFEVPARIIEVVQTERENWLRLASFIQQIEDGTPNVLAAKRARESLVDYGKFSEMENKIFRGFLFPFYSFSRHNIPNWAKAAVGKPGKAALAATGAIASFDIMAQMWNEQFFPEVERQLGPFQKDRFHVIVGNPDTGEAYTDKNGNHIVIGWEMPYEQALEMVGLARPGVLYSELFGLGGSQQDLSLIERARQAAMPQALFERIKRGPGEIVMNLLTPFIKIPMEYASNRDFFLDAPIVPDRYLGTPEEKRLLREHVVEQLFRQIREARRVGDQIERGRFDPLTSGFGLGLPINYVDLDREMQGYYHEAMDGAQQSVLNADARWRLAIDDILYERPVFSSVPEGEYQRVVEEVTALNLNPYDMQQAFRYYMQRGGRGSLARRWGSMSTEERLETWNSLPEWARTGLFYYLNFNENLGATTPPNGN